MSDNVVSEIFDTILDDWMYGYDDAYHKDQYASLRNRISSLVHLKRPLRFFLPAFPCKSSCKKKVIGPAADYAEFIAVRNLLITLRKLESLYPHGVQFTIMSDYHTFDHYIGVSEQDYELYHSGLQRLIHDFGGEDVMRLISLRDYPEFADVPSEDISEVLSAKFGGEDFLSTFDARLKTDENFLKSYTQMKKFMMQDQKHNLPGNPHSRKTHDFVKELARGMMKQGVALDHFLR